MDMENSILIMEIFYKVSSKMVDVKVKVDGLRPMEAIMKAILKIMSPTDKVDILTSTAINMKVSGKITYQMEKERLSIRMKAAIMDSFSIIKGMEKEFLLKRERHLMETLNTIK
jgi:hypothetical protein